MFLLVCGNCGVVFSKDSTRGVGLGIAACLTTNMTWAEKRVKEILKVPKRFRLFGVVYLGYPASAMKPQVRRPFEEFVAYDQAGFGRNRAQKQRHGMPFISQKSLIGLKKFGPGRMHLEN